MSRYSSIAKKHLGQNFLTNQSIIDRIINTINIQPDDTILEIGPGLGALTKKITACNVELFAIEKDPRMISELSESIPDPNFHLISGNFLDYQFQELPQITKIVGNIPYNISSPIIEKLITLRHRCRQAFLTVQLEFAKRLTARPGTKDYGALTCYTQYYAQPEILFNIPASAFQPKPKVTSAFIMIHFREPDLKALNEEFLFKVTRLAFSQRRKKLINGLSSLTKRSVLEKIFEECGIPKDVRGEDIELEKFVCLANSLIQSMSSDPNLKTNA